MERAQLHYDTAMRHGSVSIQFSYFSSLQSRWKATEYLRHSRRVKAVKSQKSLAPCFGLNATKQKPAAPFNLVHAKIPGPSRLGRYEAQFFDQALHACKSGECTKTQHVKSQQIFLQPQLLASREARVQVVVPRCQSFKILQGHEGHTLRFVFIFPKSISDAWVLVKVPSPWGERYRSDERVDGQETVGNSLWRFWDSFLGRERHGNVEMVGGREAVGNSLGKAPLGGSDIL